MKVFKMCNSKVQKSKATGCKGNPPVHLVLFITMHNVVKINRDFAHELS